MPTKKILDPRCEERLIQVVCEALTALKIENGMFIHFPSTLALWSTDEVIPKTGSVRQKLETWIDEWPVYEFVYESISRRLSACAYTPDKTEKYLHEIEGFTDIAATARELVEELSSLPWTYCFSFPLPESLGSPLARLIGNRSFGETNEIAKLDSEFKSKFPENKSGKPSPAFSLLGAFADPDPWEGRSAALTIQDKGFVGHFGWTSPVINATNKIESILGVLLALNILTVSSVSRAPRLQIPVVIHRMTGEGWKWERRIQLEHAISQVVHGLTLSGAIADETDAQLTRYFSWALGQLQSLHNCKDPSRVLLAGKWLLGSYREVDPALAFVQATVVLEILLGENSSNDKIGLSELLKNRCAYLIAKHADEREEIKDRFGQIYSVRSKIVHIGKSRLSRNEASLLEQLRIYGKRAIRKEIELLNTPQSGPATA